MADINATEIAIQIGIAKKHINLSRNCLKTGRVDECEDNLETASLCLDNLGENLKEKEYKEW